MKKIIAGFLGLSFAFYSGIAGAQSFATGATAAKESAQPAKIGVNPANRQNASATAQAENKDDLMVNSVEKKIGSSGVENRQEKKYDNTYGKVTHMRIVDGEVVFDDERYILVYYDNYKIERGLDGLTRCSMRIYVLNDLKENINSLGLKLKWPEISTNVQMNKVNPGVRTYMDVMLLGDGCLSMDKAPTIEVNRCRVRGMNEDKCADAIRWFKKNQ